eukprot:TRINITY_DN28299_c0_g1_i1.p1 TRINITY_DN28299_c0_g1~~TRINITY_DN28299_c0_g1_i1.p1  ORF type:complete len:758 (+),score=371.32 TRINITY_DN28299_c0_g1_i1:54-2327(+)
MSRRGGVLDAKQAFKGTLLQLQDKVKRDPPGYKEDVMLQLRHFESKVQLFQLTPTAANKELCELISFLSHVAPLFKKECKAFPEALVGILDRHKDVLDAHVRKSMVTALCLLRAREYVTPQEVLPLYFRLFKVQDRELRQLLLSNIVRDVKKINAKVKNPGTNKQLQNYMYQVVQEDDPIAGRHALWVILDLYRRRVWTEDRVVNVISKACLSKHTKVMTMALRFFMGTFPKDMEQDEESDDDEPEGPKKGRNYAKKTKARDTAKEKVKEKVKKYRRDKDNQYDTVFKPIEVLNDPQGFAEKLLSQLQKTKERFNVRMLHIGVISACINTHKLLILHFYPFLQRFMEPHQQHVTYIMAWASQAVHNLVPPENVHSLVMTIANHFVSDRASSDAITVGINTIREICKRQPLVMTEDLLRDIAQYKRFKKDKGVVMASRGMIQLFRELQPEMLGRQDRGRDADMEKKVHSFGATKHSSEPFDDVELLENYYQEKRDLKAQQEARSQIASENRSRRSVAATDDEDQWSAESESKKSDEDGDWISVSQSDEDLDEDGSDDGQWQSCESGDDDDDEAEEGEEEEEDEDGMFEVMEDKEEGMPLTREQLAAENAKHDVQLGGGKILETKLLTPRDFQILERLKQEKGAEGGKRKRKRMDMETDEGVTTDVLEAHSIKKRKRDAEEKRAATEALRNSFKAKTKMQKKAGGTTNAVKSKKHKNTAMVMRSRSVVSKKFETAADKKRRGKVGKKRALKFQYKRGGH